MLLHIKTLLDFKSPSLQMLPIFGLPAIPVGGGTLQGVRKQSPSCCLRLLWAHISCISSSSFLSSTMDPAHLSPAVIFLSGGVLRPLSPTPLPHSTLERGYNPCELSERFIAVNWLKLLCDKRESACTKEPRGTIAGEETHGATQVGAVCS